MVVVSSWIYNVLHNRCCAWSTGIDSGNLFPENIMNALIPMLALSIPGGIAGFAIWVVIIAAIVAIVFIACKAMGVAIPDWVIKVLWILVIAAVCIWAIKFLMTL